MDVSISTTEIESQVLEFMSSMDISPASSKSLSIDGRLHRYRVKGDKSGSENGFYCIYPDAWPAGYVGSWKHTGESVKWKYDARDLDKGKQTALRKWERSEEYQRLQTEREKQRQDAHARASDEARARFDQAGEAEPDHPYLKKKNVNTYGLRQIGENLLIPLYDEKGAFKSYQSISSDGGKLFYAGAPTSGAFFSIASDIKSGPILLCEGYATGATLHELTGHTVICAMNAGNLVTVAPAIRKLYPKRKILVAADNDAETAQKTGRNAGVEAAEKAVREGKLDGFFFPEFPDGTKGTDWNDFAAFVGIDRAAEIVRERVRWESKSKTERELDNRVRQINAADLMKMELPEVRWAIEGFLPAGCSILSGPPKTGKSILALHIGLAVSMGGYALGSILVERGDVVYMALEDTARRLKVRMIESAITEGADLSRLTFVIEIPRQHEGGLEWIERWLKEHSQARLIIIDTLQKFRKPHTSNGDRYGADYDAVSSIKSIADRYDVATLLIHHTTKAKNEDDWLNEVSGTQGLAGAADTLLFLKRGRCQGTGILRRTGRDVEEAELAMTLDGFGWKLEGDAIAFNMAEEKKQIIAHLKEFGCQSPKQIADSLNLKYETTKKRLMRMSNEGLISGKDGKYWI